MAFGIVEFGNVCFQLGTDGQQLAAFTVCQSFHSHIVPIVLGLIDFIFCKISHINGFLQGQQVRLCDHSNLVGIVGVGSGQLAFIQVSQQTGEKLSFAQELLVAALGCLLALIDPALHHFDIGHDQLQVDDINITDGIGGTFHMGNIGVLKAANYMHNGIGGANVAQEFVAKTFALAGALNKTGNIHEFNDGRSELLGLVEVSKPLQTGIGDVDNAHIGVDGAESIVISGDTCIGNGIKEGGLTHIGKTDDT